MNQNFTTQWSVLDTEERDLFASTQVKAFEDNYLPPEAHARAVELGRSVGQDFTKYLSAYQGVQLPKFSAAQVAEALPETKNLPLWKRAMSRTLKTVDWWIENVNKPTAAVGLALGSALVPGEQSFEKEFAIARKQIADENGTSIRNASVSETYEALKRSYEQADTFWGVKGGLEIIFDPLNVVGFGAPGALARIAPKTLRPMLYAANAVDQFPGVVTAKLLKAPVFGAKQVPVLKELFKPHAKSLVKETGKRVNQAVANGFGEKILSKNPADTVELLGSRGVSDMSGAGPFSLGNILNHLENDIVTFAPTVEAGEKAWAKYVTRIEKLDPEEFSAEIAKQVAQREGKAIVEGGQRISIDPFTGAPGDVVKGISANRVTKVTSILQQVKIDAVHSEQYAKVFDNSISSIASTYQRKVEPLLIRPLSLAHLTFGMFGPMNLAEDVSFAMLGQGSMKWQVNPDMFRRMTLDLVGDAAPQQFLLETSTDKMLKTMNTFNEKSTAGVTGVVNDISQKSFAAMGGTYFSELGRGVRRAAWFKDFNQTFYKILREQGADENIITELKHIITGELPPGLAQYSEEVAAVAWLAASTGDPAKVRALVNSVNSEEFIKKGMNTALEGAVQLPPDARHILRKAIFEGKVTPETVEGLKVEALEKVMEWNKFQPEAVAHRYGEMFDSIGRFAPRSAQEAIDQNDLFVASANALRDMPYEMNAQLRRQMRTTRDEKVRKTLQEQMDTNVNEVSNKLVKQMDEAGERVKALSKGVYSKEIDDALRETAAFKKKLDDSWLAAIGTKPPEKIKLFRGQTSEGRGSGMVSRGEIEVENLQLGPGQYFAPDKETAARFGDVIEKELLYTDSMLDMDIGIDELSREMLAKLRIVGDGVFLDPEDEFFDTAGDVYFALQSKYESNSATKAAAHKELNEDLKKAGIGVLKASDPMDEYNVLDDLVLGDVLEVLEKAPSPSLSTGAESTVQNIDKMVDTATQLTKLNVDTQQLLTATRQDLFKTYGSSKARSAYEGDFWEELYFPKMQEIWDINAISRADLKAQADQAWINLNAGVAKNAKMSPRNREAAIRGHQEKLNDLENRKAELMNAGGRLTDSQMDTSDFAIDGLDNDHNTISTALEALKKNRQHNTVPKIQEARRILRGHKIALAADLLNPDSEMATAMIKSDITQARRKLSKDAAEFVPSDKLEAWTALQDEIDALDTLLIENKGLSTENRVRSTEKLRELEIKQERMLVGIEKSEAVASAIDVAGVPVGVFDEAVQAVATKLDGRAPESIEEIIEILEGTSIEDAIGMAHRFGPGQQDTQAVEFLSKLYNRVVQVSDKDFLPLPQARVIDRILKGEVEQFPTRATNEMVEKGYVKVAKRYPDGSLALTLTDDGIRAHKTTPFMSVDKVEPMVIPEGIRGFNSTIDSQADELDTLLDDMIKQLEQKPQMDEAMGEMPAFTEKLATGLEQNPELMTQMKSARQQAGREANQKADRFFINYDDRNNLDFFMQRLMPFWMYESRRWPRIANLAASKPAMSKYMVQTTADWEYGYSAPTAGFEMNPMKGTILGGLRRLGSREFPEYHSGMRGKVEQTTDWLGRFGFYFAPPITGAIDIMQGETGNMVPPPLALLTHGAAAAGAEIPGLHDFVFESRYMEFLTDQVLADNFLGKSEEGEQRKFTSIPQLKSARANGDEEAIATYWAAQRQAAARMIVLQQTAILRYRPAAKTEFIKTSTDVVEQVLGITAAQQKEFRRLNVPVYSALAVSGTQRRAIREHMEEAGVNYDAWITASQSLKPVEEQAALLRIDEFWQERSRVADEFKEELHQLSDKWVDGQVSGPQARREWQEIKGRQAGAFDALQDQARFVEVPITNQERQAWREKFGGNPPLTHPVDEALEKYWSVDPLDPMFIDVGTGETNWGFFFETRDAVLESFRGEPYFEIIEQELRRGDTPLGRSLEQGKKFFQLYFGVRDEVKAQLTQTNPKLAAASDGYRQAIILAQRQLDPATKQKFLREAQNTVVANPTLLLMENMIRQRRENMRKEDPELAQWYQLFIATPNTTPKLATGKKWGQV